MKRFVLRYLPAVSLALIAFASGWATHSQTTSAERHQAELLEIELRSAEQRLAISHRFAAEVARFAGDKATEQFFIDRAEELEAKQE